MRTRNEKQQRQWHASETADETETVSQAEARFQRELLRRRIYASYCVSEAESVADTEQKLYRTHSELILAKESSKTAPQHKHGSDG
jgi:hypothetical protein